MGPRRAKHRVTKADEMAREALNNCELWPPNVLAVDPGGTKPDAIAIYMGGALCHLDYISSASMMQGYADSLDRDSWVLVLEEPYMRLDARVHCTLCRRIGRWEMLAELAHVPVITFPQITWASRLGKLVGSKKPNFEEMLNAAKDVLKVGTWLGENPLARDWKKKHIDLLQAAWIGYYGLEILEEAKRASLATDP